MRIAYPNAVIARAICLPIDRFSASRSARSNSVDVSDKWIASVPHARSSTGSSGRVASNAIPSATSVIALTA
jgi:hypothetical protein